MAVTLPPAILDRFDRATLYNSPYRAHDHGRAVDLYPGEAIAAHPREAGATHPREAGAAHPDGAPRAPSPVAGEVRDVLSVSAPSREYAAPEDHLVVVDVERPAAAAGLTARVMHVDPVVEPGDPVALGEDLGALVRSGYFAPWVPDHVHLEFREPDADPYRATGSLPLSLGVPLEPLAWDGTGEVVAAGDTYADLDAPAHPAPGDHWVGMAAAGPAGTRVLDGGLDHYPGGGLLPTDRGGTGREAAVGGATGGAEEAARGAEGAAETAPGAAGGQGPVSLAGRRVGVADGRDVAWADVDVLANGEPVGGLSLYCGRDAFGAKLVGEALDLAVGERVAVAVRRRADGGEDGPRTDG